MFSIEVSNVSKIYDNGHQALKDINLKVRKGQFLALLGKNGAGKTTLVKILTSLVKKSSGKILINGKDLDQNTQSIKISIGMMPQELNMSIFEKAIDILITQAGYFGIDSNIALLRATKLLKDLNLWDKRNQPLMSLSGGMKKRLMIARSLMHNPDIIFFDEPTTAVDVQIRKKIWEIMQQLNNQGKTIILTTHHFEEVEKLCDSVAIISKGKIIIHDPLTKILEQYTKQKFLIQIAPNNIYFIDNTINKISNTLLEVEVNIGKTLSQYIELILSKSIKIHSVQPKNNMIEELFLNLEE